MSEPTGITRAKIEALLPRDEAMALVEMLERYGIAPTMSAEDGGLVYVTANYSDWDDDVK